MELSRQEYPALLSSVSPNQAVNVLNDRITYIGKVNSDIANWLSERRRVEEIYVQGLKKLASWKGQTNSYGVFQNPWQGLLNSIESLAESHEALAKRIEADVEKPLRDFTNKNREMQSISTMKGNLASLAKDFDEAQRKSDKLQGKGTRADTSKLSSAISGVQEAGAQWESQAPFVFESLQALDESRVNHLRDVLTQLQTHEVDLLERSRAAATSTLELILNVNTAEEISAFVAQNAEGGPSLQTTRRPLTASQQPSQQDTALAPPSAPLDDRRSEISSISGPLQTPTRATAVPPSPQKKSAFGGLKRLGTVIGRRNKDSNSSSKPEKPPPPERRNKTSRNPLRRNSAISDMHQIPSPNMSAVELGDSSARQPSADVPGATARDISAAQSDSSAPVLPKINGNTSLDGIVPMNASDSAGSSHTPVLSSRQTRPPSTILEEGSPSALDVITRAQQEADASEENAQPLKLDIRSNPISEEDTAAQSLAYSSVANALRAQAGPAPRKQGTIRGRRDVRNTVFVPSGATPESVMSNPDPSTFPSPPIGHRASTDERASDAQSIRSAHSLSSLGPGVAHKHQEPTQPGLNVSIIENINTTFHEGQATKAMVTGEIALAYNGQSGSAKEAIRLDNFAVLHKVAPNPQFVEQISERSGEYTLDLSAISKSQVGFKYQVHLEDTALGTHSPLLLKPVWKIEPHQASVIVNYGWNPALTAAVDKVTLTNVIIVLHIENAKASSCMSKPVGNFSKERSQIYWKLGDIIVEKTAAEQRVLARFATDGEAKPGLTEARWEINSDHAEGLGSNLGLSVKSDDGEKREQTPDPFSDEGVNDNLTGYKSIPVARKLVSGKYSAS